MTALGPNLREARERLRLTQEQVAERGGVHAGEISRIEAGKRDSPGRHGGTISISRFQQREVSRMKIEPVGTVGPLLQILKQR